MSKSWIYHKTDAPKIVDDCELAEYLEDGWAETPAAFIEENKMKESISSDLLNTVEFSQELFEDLTREELTLFAQTRFGKSLGARTAKADMLNMIEGFFKENSEADENDDGIEDNNEGFFESGD